MSDVALMRPNNAAIPLSAVMNCTMVSVSSAGWTCSTEMLKKPEQDSKIVTIDAQIVFERYQGFSLVIIKSLLKMAIFQ